MAQHLLVRFPDTHVLLLGIFPRGSGPQDKLRQHNDKINAIVAQCKLPRTTYVNINKRFLDSSGRLLPGISRDNLHFTEKGYAIWADAVLPYHQIEILQAVREASRAVPPLLPARPCLLPFPILHKASAADGITPFADDRKT